MSQNCATPGNREPLVLRSAVEIPAGFGPCVAAIGNFDGVHLGHQEILSSVVAEARMRGARAVAITFEPHPDQFLRPDQAPRLLTPVDERLRLLALTGIDAVVVLPFDAALAAQPAREFVREILVGVLGVSSLHEGGNFRFGHRKGYGGASLIAGLWPRAPGPGWNNARHSACAGAASIYKLRSAAGSILVEKVTWAK